MTARWRVVVAAPARRDLNRVEPASAIFPVLAKLDAIAANPRRVGKPLRFAYEGSLVTRSGPFRVLYELDEEERLVKVTAIGHRSHVYRGR